MTGILASGAYIGRFRIEAEIGRGGMGVVYRAFDADLKRPVAIKLLAPHLDADPDSVKRFDLEATAVATLKHPHIAMVYEFGEQAGQPYIVFEWVEGRTLKALLAEEGRMSPQRTLRLVSQLCGALDYAHRRGVIHRDLKPANIIIGPGDHATIIDFGLARLATITTITASHGFLGTPRYVAPEQIRGETLDGRSDLYSLAIIIYEILAGEPPFAEPGIHALLHQHLTATPPPISEINPTLPSAIEPVLARALQKERADRFDTLAEFDAALTQAFSATMALPARERSRRWAGWLAALAVVLLVGAVAVAALRNSAPQTSADSAAAGAPTAAIMPEPAALATAEATAAPATETTQPTPEAAASPAADGWWPMSSGNAAQTGLVDEELKLPATEARWSRNLRTGQITSMVAGEGLVVFAVNYATLRALDWSNGLMTWETQLDVGVVGPPALYGDQQNALLLFPTSDNSVRAFDLADGAPRWQTPPDALQGAIYGGVTMSDEGTLYAATDTGWLYGLQPLTGEIAWSRPLTETGGFVAPPTIAAATIFLAGSNETLYALDAATRETTWTAATTGKLQSKPCAAEALGLVFVGTEQGRVQAFAIDSGAQRWVATANSGIVGLSTDGKYIYATTYNGTVYAWDAASGEIAWLANTDSVISAAPLTDGSYVVVGTQAGEVRFLDAASGVEERGARLEFQSPIVYPPVPAGGWLFVQAAFIYGFGP